MKENAYFTVEAALVFPVAAGIIIFIIYMLLFQYDRCLQEQDIGAAMLWGSRLKEEDSEGLQGRMQGRLANIDRDKYAAWEFTRLRASIEKNVISVRGEGRLVLVGARNAWCVESEFQCGRLSPTAFIRLCRGVANLLDEDEDEEEQEGQNEMSRRENRGKQGKVSQGENQGKQGEVSRGENRGKQGKV